MGYREIFDKNKHLVVSVTFFIEMIRAAMSNAYYWSIISLLVGIGLVCKKDVARKLSIICLMLLSVMLIYGFFPPYNSNEAAFNNFEPWKRYILFAFIEAIVFIEIYILRKKFK